MIDHIGFEVSDLQRSARFYDAVFFALGGRRMIDSEHAVAYGINDPQVWIVVRGRPPGTRLRARGAARQRQGRSGRGTPGRDWPTAAPTTDRPGPRPQYGRRYYAAYLKDPDGLRVEVVSRR